MPGSVHAHHPGPSEIGHVSDETVVVLLIGAAFFCGNSESLFIIIRALAQPEQGKVWYGAHEFDHDDIPRRRLHKLWMPVRFERDQKCCIPSASESNDITCCFEYASA